MHQCEYLRKTCLAKQFSAAMSADIRYLLLTLQTIVRILIGTRDYLF